MKPLDVFEICRILEAIDRAFDRGELNVVVDKNGNTGDVPVANRSDVLDEVVRIVEQIMEERDRLR